jgi:hypothetical protein
MNYKVSGKRKDTGKWWTFGNIKTNQYGNLQLSFKNTDEFKKFIEASGDWLNFSLFPDDEEKKEMQKSTPQTLSDEIPF